MAGVALATAAIVFAGCGGDATSVDPQPWASAVVASEQTVEVRYRIASVHELERVEVAERGARVEITLIVSRPGAGEVPLRLEARCVRVVLRQPLGNRRLIDGATGAARRPVEAAVTGSEGCPRSPR